MPTDMVVIVSGSLEVLRNLYVPRCVKQGLAGIEGAKAAGKQGNKRVLDLVKVSDFARYAETLLLYQCSDLQLDHVYLWHRGDVLGMEEILNQQPGHRFMLKTTTKSDVLFMPRNYISALFAADPAASMAARKLALMRLPPDESLLRRVVRTYNW